MVDSIQAQVNAKTGSSKAIAAGKQGSGEILEPPPSLHIRLLGPVRVLRDGVEVRLPRSRKVRALLGFLALESLPKSRSRLCDLLWEIPNDPRGELRWCLSKLRGVLDQGRRRVLTTPESLIALDLSDCLVDAVAVERLAQNDITSAASEQLAAAIALFGGDLLDGLTVEGAELMGWLVACRQRYRALHTALVGEMALREAPDSEARLRWLETWLELAPFDHRAHEAMVETLIKTGHPRQAQDHVNRTIRAFEQEGLDWGPVRAAWQSARLEGKNLATVEMTSAALSPPLVATPEAGLPRPGSVLIMPFGHHTPGLDQLASGLTEELVTRLAKLRVLFVIARGTSYALQARGLDAQEAARLLNVEYVVSGTVRRQGDGLAIHVELAHSQDAGIVWADRADAMGAEPLGFLDATVDRIVAAIAEQIEQAECKRAISKPPSSLDAWESYHRGLWHMYLFTGSDNQTAQQYFQTALALDPSFARAHAGLSFTHFQNVFLNLKADRQYETMQALESATRSVASDDRDPAAHWAMGRALWLRGESAEAVTELERSVELGPSFALGHYTLGFLHSQAGDPQTAIAACDTSRELSPFDPLQFAMLASRALAHIRLGQSEQAAEWAVKAVGRPNAHVHILAIAATSLSLCGRRDPARALVARIRSGLPGYDIEAFLRSFRFPPEAERLFRRAAKPIGLA